MDLFVQISQFLLSLSFLIILHELGHFIPARLFKTRVEKFYLFFDFLFPFPNILPFSLLKFKKGETTYGLGWFPFGGYVKIAGMVDESMDKEAMAKPPQPWEFRSKPAWQRLIIMLGGIIMNVIIAVVVYGMILFTWGKEYLPAQNAEYGVYCDSLALNVGFQHGDKIIAMDGKPIPADYTYGNITGDILLEGVHKVTVDRNGQEETVTLPKEFEKQVISKRVRALFSEQFPFYVTEVQKKQGAARAGIQEGDRIVGVANETLNYFQPITIALRQHKGETTDIEIIRNGEKMNVPVDINEKGMIGVKFMHPDSLLKTNKKTYTLGEAIPGGFVETWNILDKYIKQFKLIFSKEGVQQLGGFGTIGSLYPTSWDWHIFWERTAFISIILAFMNLLPIPALDGGHVMFLTYELITGRKPNEKLMEYAQIAGMVFLLVFMLYANGMDVIRSCSPG